MTANIDDEAQELLTRLAGEVRAAQQLVAEAVRSLRRREQASIEQVRTEFSRLSQRLSALERNVLHRLRRSPPDAPGADDAYSLALLRMANDIRQVGVLAETLAVDASVDSPDLHELLDRAAAPVLLQLSQAHDALLAPNATEAERALDEDKDLDDWCDLVLKDVLDDIAEQGCVPDYALTLLSSIRHVERIGEHAIALAADVAIFK